jgi:hypothetical protein
MIDLLEHILTDDYVSATELFEARLNVIREKKLYEMKQDIQAEAFGGLTKADIEARRKAGYVKASDVLPDPRDYVPENEPKKKKIAVRRKKKLSENSIDTPIPSTAHKWIEKRRKEQEAKKQKHDGEREVPKKPKSIFDRPKKNMIKKQPKISTDTEKPKTGVVGRKVKGFVKDYGNFMGRLGSSIISGLGEENT